MKFSKKNLKISTITAILLLTMSASLIALPTAFAQPGTTWPSFPVLSIIPDQSAVGQEVLLSYGITRQTAWPQSGWTGITVTVTAPDGSTQTLGPYNTDTTGLGGAVFIPTMAGTYKFVCNFPEQDVTTSVAGLEAGTTMLASHTPEIELVVTEDGDRHFFPDTPMPDEYWVRPIDAQNREWFSVAGSWLDGNYKRGHYNRNADGNDGPETGHILWEMIQDVGGLAGGLEMGWHSFEDGDAYEGKWSNPMIIAGTLIGVRYVRGTQVTYAVNVRTGEMMWEKVLGEDIDLALSPGFGQVFYWTTMNNHGCYAYLWATQGSTWHAFDPLTGRWEYTMTNVPGGTRVPGPNGEILLYNINGAAGTLTKWNSTAAYYDMMLAGYGDSPTATYEAGRWRPIGTTFDAEYGVEYTVPVPIDQLSGALSFGFMSYGKLVIPEDRIIGGNTEWAGGAAVQNPHFWAIDLRPGHEGELIFSRNWDVPEAGVHYDFAGSHPFSVEYDLFVVTGKETRKHYAISMTTGQQLWATTAFEPYNNAYSNVYMDPWGQSICYGDKLITQGFGGVSTAYSLVDGSMVWQYRAGNEYGEFLFGNDWSIPAAFTADGKLYLVHAEHSAIDPKPRGAPTICLDIATGNEVWRTDGLRLGTRWGGQPIIGDSVITAFSSYDNTIVALGKGPSELTIKGPDTSVPLGNEVLITGTVMDVSPGTKDPEAMLRFSDGVPAISDGDMSEWMLYVYKHRPRPANAVGVNVKIEAVTPNMECIQLGTTTSDSYGKYGFAFKPEMQGVYTIIATFEGSGGYFGSTSTTYVNVGQAGSASTPIEPDQPHGTPVITTEVAIILAVVIAAVIGVAAFWALKRK
ncbi:MAG: PQQ-binding-like beta-propeller repeat protein [Candidatus Bathyarchaeota archaeon]|nr:PQQ-binding-like beta-propeller repeat protein [Candidatus Bathyarchaeum tardum]WGM90011.1 MAG: PQQ-binding-like beta-propeller repeat protein [Candidatus Bathyarchaeum tardum]WNZ29849.1 MAG: PQQ-binding-like beta-propeller repeat protein [Candidatus Bathyarchaeota archaeon]